MDPITTALLVAQGIAGIGKTGYGIYQQRAGKKALSGVQEASRMKPAEYAEMLREAKKGQAVQARIEEINRGLSTSTDALQQAGSRAVIGGIGKVTQAGTTATNQLLGQQQQDIMRALGVSAMGSERMIGRNTQRELQEKGLAQSAINAGVQNTVGGLSDIGSAIGYAASLDDSASSSSPELNEQARIDMLTDQTQAGIYNQAVAGAGAYDFGGSDVLQSEELKKLLEGVNRLPTGGMQSLEELEELEEFQHGGMVTDGPFSHDKNPIYMVQGGDVVGEMTGGEYILNPKQAKAISKESKYFRNLLKQKRFK